MRSAEAFPAVMVMFPVATAVIIGGSSVDSVAMVKSLDAQLSPVTGWPLECVLSAELRNRKILFPAVSNSCQLYAESERGTVGSKVSR